MNYIKEISQLCVKHENKYSDKSVRKWYLNVSEYGMLENMNTILGIIHNLASLDATFR
jgi:hypothetical protein